MNLRLIDWIWRIRGSVPLAPERSADEAFARLAPLLAAHGTRYERSNDTLTFWKREQAAQDKMAVFDGGTLRIETGAAGSELRYHLSSRILLLCFLAPLLFLCFAGLTVVVGKLQTPETAAEKAQKKIEEEKISSVQSPIDKFLGAPAPEKTKKDEKNKSGNKNSKFSPTSAYVFAGIFAFLYVVGRIIEARMINSLLRKHLR